MRVVTTANLIVLDSQNRILLISRNEDEDRFKGYWSIPGGGAEIGETIEQALERETLEELGCRLGEFKYFRSFYYEVSEDLHVRAFYFVGKIEGEIKLSDEHGGFDWFKKEDLENLNIAYNQKEVLNEFFE